MSSMDFTVFQNRLRELMDSRGLSMKSLAEQVNTTPATVSRYLSSDRKPDLAYIVKLAEFFGVSIGWMLGLEEDRYAPLPKEHQELINLYSMATPDDRMVVKAVLNKYQNKE